MSAKWIKANCQGKKKKKKKNASNQGNGVDEFGASLFEIHGASTLTAAAGVIQLRLRFNCDLNGVCVRVCVHVRGS